jgi:hypothetical protein
MAEEKKREKITKVIKLETIGDYLAAVETSLLDCCCKLDPEEVYNDDNVGVYSLVFNALENCEALYAASRINAIGKRMSVTSESFSPRDYIIATSSSYIKNRHAKSEFSFKAGDSLILHCFMLYGYAAFTERMQDLLDSPEHTALWPRNPCAQVFTASGLSYLEAMFNFTKENAIKVARLVNSLLDNLLKEEPQMRGKVKELPVTPNPPFIKDWGKYVLDYMRQNLPVQDISNTAMRAEFNSVRAKGEDELNRYIQNRFKTDIVSKTELLKKPTETGQKKQADTETTEGQNGGKAVLPEPRKPENTPSVQTPFTKKEEEISGYFEMLKSSGKLGNEPDLHWYPKTITDYRILAYLIPPDITINPDFVELSKIRSYIISGFTKAVEVILESRNFLPGPEGLYGSSIVYLPDRTQIVYHISQYRVLNCCLIWKLRDFLQDQYGFSWWGEEGEVFGDPHREQLWPINAKSKAFDSAGISSLHAAANFFDSVYHIVWATLAKSIESASSFEPDNLVIEPKPDVEVLKWQKLLSEKLSYEMPALKWPDNTIQGECDSLVLQINEEYKQAIRNKQAEKEQRTPPTSDKAVAEIKPTVTEAANVFRKNGDFWFLRFDSKPSEPMAIKDEKGMAYIAELLAKPNKLISARDFQEVDADLLRKGANLATGDTFEDEDGDGLTAIIAEPIATDEALRKVYERLKEIPAEIDKAQKNDDLAEIEKLKTEKYSIQEYLAKTILPGSHTAKTFHTEAKKTKNTVAQAISRAIASIKEKKELESLGIHLKQAIHQAGVDFNYTPAPTRNWDVNL